MPQACAAKVSESRPVDAGDHAAVQALRRVAEGLALAAPRPAPPDPARLAAVLEALPIGVYLVDRDGFVTYANAAATGLIGRPVAGARWCITDRLFASDGTAIAPGEGPMAQALRGAGAPLEPVETIMEREDGGRVALRQHPTPLFDAAGTLVGGFNLLEDISASKQIEARLALSNRRDGLTGLPNRLALGQDLSAHIQAAEQDGQRFGLLRLDIEGFKSLNDAFGPGCGDAVLVEVARRLKAGLPGAAIWRSGGDEFVVVARLDQERNGATGLAERVVSLFRTPFCHGGRAVPIAISGGLARFPEDAADETRLAAGANQALHLAKTTERGSIRMFDPRKQALAEEQRALRQQLRLAIDTGQIGMVYQPLFAKDGSIAGFEALARWRHPVKGEIAPADFIAEAEAAGLIASLDNHILRSACREAASWRNRLSISVNISPLEFLTGDLTERVEAVLLETGLDPERLELEITESIMVSDAEKALAALGRLRALGIGIALDDFGTGYSSLSYLHRFPLTTLKIDRSFVARLGETLESVAITRAVIQLGHALGIRVVAEGVETPEQLDFLIQEGCDLTQGYLLGRPGQAQDYAGAMGRPG
ncbi:EAL domain-containing protein [Bosea sp. Leaf344]|uniref:EAL domain-containing protein n=1 Tax=Bosea sp. Leaf344 TaxID=1736346 RepID=UPI000A930BA4